MTLDIDGADIKELPSLLCAFGEAVNGYPATDPSGTFRIYVVKDEDWEQPVHDESADLRDLRAAIARALRVVASRRGG